MTIYVSFSVFVVFLFFVMMYLPALSGKKWSRNSPVTVYVIYLYLVVASVFSPLGGDKMRYIEAFHDAPIIEYVKDFGWTFLTKVLNVLCFDNENLYLSVIAFLYVLGYYLIGKCRLDKRYLAYFLLLSAGCLGFWSGSTNIMRAGLATSLFLMSLCSEKKIVYVVFVILAFEVHNSILILVGGYFLTKYCRNYNVYLIVWIVFLALSSVNALGVITSFLSAHMGDVGDRIAEYAYSSDADVAELYKNAGFRLDFIAYSALAIIYSRWLIVKRGYKDEFFERISCTYIIANCFWLTMIRVFYADRFALLSWSLIPLIILYPYMNKENRLPFEKRVVFVAFLPVLVNLAVTLKDMSKM